MNEAASKGLGADECEMVIEDTCFSRVSSLEVLGACLSTTAESLVSIKFCIQRAWQRWFQRRPQLCRRRVPLSKRIERYLSTVGLTLLHGTEGILLTQGILREVQSFDRCCLREMLCMQKPSAMGWTEFRRRQYRILRDTFSGMGRLELAGQLLKKQFGWAGHGGKRERAKR